MLQAIQSATDDFIQEEIDTNRHLLLKHLDTSLRQSQTLNSLSLAELELDKLITKEVRTKMEHAYLTIPPVTLPRLHKEIYI